MTPIPLIVVPPGDGKVNATALDGAFRSIVAQTNAVIEALNVALTARTTLADRSVRARHLGGELRGMLADMAARVASIRRTLLPGVTVQPVVNETAAPSEVPGRFLFESDYTDNHTLFQLGGDPIRTYRLRFRIRSAIARCLFSPSFVRVRGLARTYVGSNIVLADSGTNFAADVAPMLLNTTRVPLVMVSGEVHRIVAVLAGPDRIVVDSPFVTSLANGPVDVSFVVGTYMRNTHAFQTELAAIAAGGAPLGDGVWRFPPGTMAPLGGADFAWLSTANEDILLNGRMFDPLAGLVDQQLPLPQDVTFDLYVPGDASLSLHCESSDARAAFMVEGDYPVDDDPRFPAAYRFPRAQFAQLDLVSIEPIVEPADGILTESGIPIQGESPQATLLPEQP